VFNWPRKAAKVPVCSRRHVAPLMKFTVSALRFSKLFRVVLIPFYADSARLAQLYAPAFGQLSPNDGISGELLRSRSSKYHRHHEGHASTSHQNPMVHGSHRKSIAMAIVAWNGRSHLIWVNPAAETARLLSPSEGDRWEDRPPTIVRSCLRACALEVRAGELDQAPGEG